MKGFNTTANHLIGVIKKDKGFIWEQEQEGAFKTLKQMLNSTPLLQLP